MKTILVLFGGCSTEYGVSLQSAHGILSHMDRGRYTPLPVGITREGRWLWYPGSPEHLADGTWQDRPECVPCTLSLDRGQGHLLALDESGASRIFDAAFPVLHGKNGEDGTIQGLLELTGIPLIGCGALSSALCMDKDRAHKLVSCTGIRVPKSMLFRRGASPDAVAAAAEELGYPLFVKPVRSGSSYGVSRITASSQLPGAVQIAFAHDREILLEEAVPGFEVGCAVLGNEALTVGAVDEIALSGGFFDFAEKYTLKTSAIHCPARISPQQAARIQEAAKVIYRALDCRVFARVDLFLTPQGDIVFNEVNTIPGFTVHSRYPNMMRAAGWNFTTLVTRILELGVEA